MVCQGKCSQFCAKLEPLAWTLLRIATGVIMACHGWDKLTHIPKWTAVFESMTIPYPGISIYLAIAGEFLGGLGLIVGLLTPIAAFGIFCTMTVAIVHVNWYNGLISANNGFEYPLVLFLVAFFFMVKGAGPLSLDHLIKSKCCSESKTN